MAFNQSIAHYDSNRNLICCSVWNMLQMVFLLFLWEFCITKEILVEYNHHPAGIISIEILALAASSKYDIN
jgi:hypothetical protein